jgi:hypothetical protein
MNQIKSCRHPRSYLQRRFLTAGWLGCVNSGINAALRLKIGAGDMNESNSALDPGRIPSSGFNRCLASVGEFRHVATHKTEDRGLLTFINQILPVSSSPFLPFSFSPIPPFSIRGFDSAQPPVNFNFISF